MQWCKYLPYVTSTCLRRAMSRCYKLLVRSPEASTQKSYSITVTRVNVIRYFPPLLVTKQFCFPLTCIVWRKTIGSWSQWEPFTFFRWTIPLLFHRRMKGIQVAEIHISAVLIQISIDCISIYSACIVISASVRERFMKAQRGWDKTSCIFLLNLSDSLCNKSMYMCQ